MRCLQWGDKAGDVAATDRPFGRTFYLGDDTPMNSLTQKVSRKIAWRLIPFLILCFFIAYLDRVNAGFAALTMNKELGLTAEMFGFGVGIFFFGYFHWCPNVVARRQHN